MPNFFETHDHGCTPLKPCVTCRSVRFLKAKLSDSDFSQFLEIATNAGSNSPAEYSAENPAPLDFVLDALDIPVRITNALRNEDIQTLEQLLQKKPNELLRLPNFGNKSWADLNEAVKKIGHSLPSKKK